MDLDVQYELRKQHCQDILREAEQYRLARKAGYTEVKEFRLFVARLWGFWLQVIRVMTHLVACSRTVDVGGEVLSEEPSIGITALHH
jgi:hypothetical protein